MRRRLQVVRSRRLELNEAGYRVAVTQLGNMLARGIALNHRFRNTLIILGTILTPVCGLVMYIFYFGLLKKMY
jgi:hypothetical protein